MKKKILIQPNSTFESITTIFCSKLQPGATYRVPGLIRSRGRIMQFEPPVASKDGEPIVPGVNSYQ